jgi:heme-degrading monooxygenase HmoA
MRIRTGVEGADVMLQRQYEQVRIPGHVATHLYRSDADPREFYLSVLFESREAYEANARSPEQDARYRQLRQLLEADPEWHDGEVVYEQVTAQTRR